jgi:hypothetical protein
MDKLNEIICAIGATSFRTLQVTFGLNLQQQQRDNFVSIHIGLGKHNLSPTIITKAGAITVLTEHKINLTSLGEATPLREATSLSEDYFHFFSNGEEINPTVVIDPELKCIDVIKFHIFIHEYTISM